MTRLLPTLRYAVFIVVAAAVVVAASAPASALTPRQRTAIATFKKGKQHFDAAEYERALPLLRKADELHPGGAPKFMIAKCLDKLGRAADALAAYRTFLDSDPGERYADRIKEAKARVVELDKQLAPAKE